MAARSKRLRKGKSSGRTAEGPDMLAARRHALVHVVERQLRDCGVLQPRSRKPERVVIGVSGGADSVALLLACAAIAAREPINQSALKLTAVHVHHHLRRSAAADAAFVRRLCRSMNVPCVVEHVRPSRMNGNLSANARSLRYSALGRQARKRRAGFVLTAHHAEDQFETMLMAMCRGSGLEGLAGMPMTRVLDEHTCLVRPLLDSSRADCELLCTAAGVKWREDPTNRDITKARARVRHDVVPILTQLWPGCSQRISATSRDLREMSAMLDSVVSEAFGATSKRRWPRNHLNRMPAMVIRHGLRCAIVQHDPTMADALNREHLTAAAAAICAADRRPRTFDWPNGWRLSVSATSVALSRTRFRFENRPKT